MTDFDPVLKIRELDERLGEVEKTVDVLADEILENPNLVREAPYATTDASGRGVTLTRSVEAGALSDAVLAALRDAGYDTLEKIRDAFDEELLAISGIGPKTLKQIRTQIG
jgi:hypothetical protein